MRENAEKRHVTRWKINWQAQLICEGEEAPVKCRVMDCSFRGIRVITDERLKTDAFYRFMLCLSSDCAIDIEVWLVWHKTVAGANAYGFYFTRIADSDKEKIYKFMLQNFPRQVYNKWWQGEQPEEGGEAMEDRRVFARFEKKLPVKIFNLNLNSESAAQTFDFSAKGLGLVANEHITNKTPLEMWLAIPDKGEPLYTRGEVVWSRRVEADKYRIGVSLEDADLMALSRILRIN